MNVSSSKRVLQSANKRAIPAKKGNISPSILKHLRRKSKNDPTFTTGALFLPTSNTLTVQVYNVSGSVRTVTIFGLNKDTNTIIGKVRHFTLQIGEFRQIVFNTSNVTNAALFMTADGANVTFNVFGIESNFMPQNELFVIG